MHKYARHSGELLLVCVAVWFTAVPWTATGEREAEAAFQGLSFIERFDDIRQACQENTGTRTSTRTFAALLLCAYSSTEYFEYNPMKHHKSY